jgi:NAD(P)-dependent dehydrogenase (short-subunit alcohol dehydrogenase family)
MTKTWLITGSSRGFGWELAKAVLDSGGPRSSHRTPAGTT